MSSADPSSAEQETCDQVVTVGGDNFGANSEVDFLVTGTENPGGIHVKNVKRQGLKTLKVTIDADETTFCCADADSDVYTDWICGGLDCDDSACEFDPTCISCLPKDAQCDPQIPRCSGRCHPAFNRCR